MADTTELVIPEIMLMLVHPVSNGTLCTDIDWTANRKGSVTMSFCGVDAFAEGDCKTEASPPKQILFACSPGDDVVRPRTLYRFAERTISVPHGTEGNPVKAPHGLMIKFNIRGCLPESDKLLPAEQRMPLSNQLQPVVTATLRYPQLYETANAAERNQSIVVVTQRRAMGPTLCISEAFDIWYQVHTQSPENPNVMAVMHIGILHSADKQAHERSKLAARSLDACYCLPFAEISPRLMAVSKERVEGCQHLFAGLTDKTTADNCALSMMTLKIGSALCIEQQDWAQWGEGTRIQGSVIADALMPILIGACLDVCHDLVTTGQAYLDSPTPAISCEQIMHAVRECPTPVIDKLLRARIQKEVATAVNYTFDVKIGISIKSLTINNVLTGTPEIMGSGENQNIGGQMSIDTLAANRRQLLPLLGVLRASLHEELGACPASHTHPQYCDLGLRVHQLHASISKLQRNLTRSQNDCEDVATQLALAYNAASVMSQAHFRHQDKHLAEPVCSCRMCNSLGVYASAVPQDTEFMPAVAAIMHAVDNPDKNLSVGLDFASGANRDLAAAGVLVPRNVGDHTHGVFNVLKEGLQGGTTCGHAVAVHMPKEPLHVGHPAHAVLAQLQLEGRCANMRLSQIAVCTEFFEGTSCSERLADTLDMSAKVDVRFEPVSDRVMQKKLDVISAQSMVSFKATNLIAALQMQGMHKLGIKSSVEQKFTTNDSSCFYQNVISEGDAVALTTGYDGGTTLQVAPTGYIPSAISSVTRMLVHTPCSAEETNLLTMLWEARVAMNPSLTQILENAATAGVTTPPMRLRGVHRLQNHAGERSTVVLKSGCYPGDATWTWDKEHNARCQLALQHGMASVRHISSHIWLAHFYSNPRVPGG